MALSWNEIKTRALAFSKEWESEANEDAEAKSFLDGFFDVFGINRRRVGSFEKKVKTLDGKTGYMDMLWKGQILIEMKSRGKDLGRAYKQATDYFDGLAEVDLPKYILVCDFEKFRLYDLEEGTDETFELKEFYKNVKLFGFIAGYQKKTYKAEDPVNIKAAELMGKLHDELKAVGYTGHQLELYLVRLLFCLFADDTSIFDPNIFLEYIENKTRVDGSDVGPALAQLFQILNTPADKRMKSLDEDLAAFPYVNGKLFEEPLQLASWNSHMRTVLLKCCALNWGAISPAIFGSMFQSVMDEKARRNIGAHYTSERNILKLIKPLFLDELWADFDKIKNDRKELDRLHKRIASLRFLDPACGCGNFLVITYRELRLLELEIIKALQKGQQVLNIEQLIRIDVDQFYGIEYEEFPAQIAQVAMWLTDHQMNMMVNEQFGQYFRRLPLKKAATIIHGNALRIDWQSLLNPVNSIDIYADHANIYVVEEPATHYKTLNVQVKGFKKHKGVKPEPAAQVTYNYILGNPPFVGKSLQNVEQKADMEKLFSGIKGAGVLDYVSAWYLKAAQFIQDTKIRVAFVSTNSIAQGEQAGLLWNFLFKIYKIKIHFAHNTFKWANDAKANAAVHVVIIGFANYDIGNKSIYEYENIAGEPHLVKAKNINPYLVEGNDFALSKRTSPICPVPTMNYGNMPNEGGNLLLDENEKKELLLKEPSAKKFIRKFVMGEELINSIPRYCIWLKNIQPSELRLLPKVSERVSKVYQSRNSSNREATRKLAAYPTLFGEIRQPTTNYIALPRVSSENRKFIPIAILSKEIIAGDKVYTISSSDKFIFGILTSTMHMSWMRVTSGRLKSDYSYSNQLTYNNFPWPENPSDKQKATVEKAAQKVLDVRTDFPESSLADLYDPLTMPPALVKTHQELDKAVDLCYRPQAFVNETKRIEYLFELYDKYTSGLFVTEKKTKAKV